MIYDMPTAMRWVETRTSDRTCAICKTCGGRGWVHFSCGTPWRCKCNTSSLMHPSHPLYPYFVTTRQQEQPR